MMKRTAFAVAALALGGLVSPASAQIIATSIPKAGAAAPGKGVGAEKQFAFHIMGAHIAKWKINSFEEDAGLFLASSANPNSKFLLAGEAVFAAGSDFSIGLGGWYNKVGNTNYDFVFLDTSAVPTSGLLGVRLDDVTYTEGHVNAFYKDIGIQAGLVHSKATPSGLTINQFFFGDVTLSRADLVRLIGSGEVSAIEAGARVEVSATDFDSYLVYKTGSSRFNRDTKVPWTVSAGAGLYHYQVTSKTVFSGFLTGSVDLYKGLGLDVSFWYIGKSNSENQKVLGVVDNLSRFSVGIGYSFSR
jgi:hypothetical protein